jgi:hypothetical protein
MKRKDRRDDEIPTRRAPGFVHNDALIAEEVYDGERARFILWYGEGHGKNEYVDVLDLAELGLGEERLLPIAEDLVRKGAILLPSDVEEYGDGAALFDGLVAWAEKWVDIERQYLELAVAAVLVGWLWEKAPVLPIVNPRGGSETGKSRLGTVLWTISYRGMRCDGNLSLPSLFRNAERWNGTLYLNEGDLKPSRVEDSESNHLLKFLNARYEQRSFVWRVNKETHEPEAFRAFGPTIVTSRKGFPDDALESRCWVIPMRTTRRDDVPLNLPPEFYEEAQAWRNRLLLFRLRNLFAFENDFDLRFDGLQPRVNQILQPVASLALKEIPALYARLRAIADSMNERVVEDRADSLDGLVVRAYFQCGSWDESVTSKQLSERIREAFGGDVSPRSAGRRLAALGFTFRRTGRRRSWSLEREKWSALAKKYCPRAEREAVLGALTSQTTQTSPRQEGDGTTFPTKPSQTPPPRTGDGDVSDVSDVIPIDTREGRHPHYMLALERARDLRSYDPNRPPASVALEVEKELRARGHEPDLAQLRAGAEAGMKGGSP